MELFRAYRDRTLRESPYNARSVPLVRNRDGTYGSGAKVRYATDKQERLGIRFPQIRCDGHARYTICGL
jgi:hypothetical protein